MAVYPEETLTVLRALAGKLARGLSGAPGTCVIYICQCVCLGRLRAALVWSSNEVCRKTSGSPARQDPQQEVEAFR